MNNSVFGKTMENVRKQILNLSQQKDQQIIQYQNQITMLQSFSQNIYLQQKRKKKNKKKQILMNKPVYLGLSILEVSNIMIYEFWCDYVKP